MARKHLMAAVTALGLVIAVPVLADMPTIDITAIKQLRDQIAEIKKQYAAELEQLNTLKEQLDFLNDINKFVNEVSDAIGKITHITLPIPRIDKFASQIKGDMRCLMPDGIGWGIKFEDMNLGSICDLASTYKKALFVDQDKLAKMNAYEQLQARDGARGNREALFQDTVVRSLAQSDVQMKQADELNNAADDLQSSLGSAATVQDRLHVQAQVQILQARAAAAQSQVLAQMLKLQAAGQAAAGLSDDAIKAATGEEGK